MEIIDGTLYYLTSTGFLAWECDAGNAFLMALVLGTAFCCAIANVTLNYSSRRIGGLRFFKLGRFCLSFCVTREYRSL